MSDQPETAPFFWQRSRRFRFFRWLRGSKWRMIVFALVVWLVAMTSLFYGREDWRGLHAWNKYRVAAEARGESFDLATFIPKSVPDEENSAATPFFKACFLHPNNTALANDFYARAAANIGGTKAPQNRGRRSFTDLVAWQMAFAAHQKGPLKPSQKFATDKTDPVSRAAAAPLVLEGMKTDAAVFAELRAASTRKYSRYPVQYDLENPLNTSLQHLAKIKEVCLRLSLQSCAKLAAGQTNAALADVKLILAVADSLKSEPFLLSTLVRVACVSIAVQPVWEGLAQHRWGDAQLQELEACF